MSLSSVWNGTPLIHFTLDEQTRSVTLFFIDSKVDVSLPTKHLYNQTEKALNRDFIQIEHKIASSHTYRFLESSADYFMRIPTS